MLQSALTLDFLLECRANIKKQGDDAATLMQQASGALRVLDELIRRAQEVVVVPETVKTDAPSDITVQ